MSFPWLVGTVAFPLSHSDEQALRFECPPCDVRWSADPTRRSTGDDRCWLCNATGSLTHSFF